MIILLIGQCTLHWGRMEFGNIGNYYIIEPLVRELHKNFPNSKIKTTFQMSKRFCDDEKIEVLNMDLYYGWKDDDLEKALIDLSVASLYKKTGVISKMTPFIKEVIESDLVIDFSGDIWGDNANFLGPNRFLVGLIKDRVAQLLGKKTIMIAGSPGPFKNQKEKEFAKEVYKNFDFVTNREPISIKLLEKKGFDISKTKSYACPAFLFNPDSNLLNGFNTEKLIQKSNKLKIGFILCGWNFSEGPFDKENRHDDEFTKFAEVIESISNSENADIFLFSHSNGFPIPPKEFNLIHGRDFNTVKQLKSLLDRRKKAKNIILVNEVLNCWQIKKFIASLDILISGRVHGAVAGLSQCVPTVIIDYGHEPKAHKLLGFAKVVGIEEYVANPNLKNDLLTKITYCLENKLQYKAYLEKQIPNVKELARKNFSEINYSIKK